MQELLYLEDDKDLRNAFIEILSEEFIVRATSNVQDTIEEIERKRPEVIILDYNLEGTNSLAVIDFLNLRNISIPIIFFTAKEKNYINKKVSYSNYKGTITKPSHNIFEEINRLLFKN